MSWRIQEFLKGVGVGAVEGRGRREADELLLVIFFLKYNEHIKSNI
jgi:hypothetical protein